ncbi:hypothetical protein B0H19DRAFT_954151 [Mycena capillaripes]|nr:hypothetical protein B0H19DRAFT_954151 [Mycena capillaripes]
MVLLSALALSLLCSLVFSVPVPDDNSTTSLLIPVADTADSPLTTVLDAVNTLLLAPAQIIDLPSSPPPSDPSTTADPSLLSIDASQSTTPISLLPTTTEVITVTQLLTEPPTTIIVSAAPSTITDIVTVFVPTSPAPPPSATSTSTTPAQSGAKAAWAAPPQMTDLAAFNISAFPGGQQNLRLVTGVPASASATAPALLDAFLSPSGSERAAYMPWDNASTVMQLLYPEDSANPAARPQGGAEFYATPLDIADAQVVSMCYSVFFPADFDWVKAGKLPGLYGGRVACSGGDAALDCFSTRLMWRQHGQGELYLYAAKDKQTHALCANPQSVCDAAYGFSIGRGSFTWRAGGWTTVCQIVQLNTPGMQDGGFWLYADGELKIQRDDIFYRDALPAKSSSASAYPSATSTSSSTSDDDDGGNLIPGLLSGILDRRTTKAQEVPRDARPLLLPAPTPAPQQPTLGEKDVVVPTDPREWAVQLSPNTPIGLPTAETTTTSTITTTVIVYPTLIPASEQAAPRTGPVGFIGIFFR